MSDEVKLPPPATDQAYMNVSALEAGNITIPIDKFVAGANPASASCPSLAFYLRHSKTGFQIVFDLGTRRDFEEYPPATRKRIQDLGFSSKVDQNVAESLEKGGVPPDEVDAVVVSHLHWDHIGDHAPFTKATFVVGEGCRELLANGYPKRADALFSSTAIPVERARFLSKSELSTTIGPYPHALDFFGDGSLYVVDAPGHVAGHLNVLARTSADGSWILLGGDSAHDWRIVTGVKECACETDTATGKVRYIMHANKEAAEENLERVRALLRVPRVRVLIAHDVPWYEANKGGPAFLPGVIPALY